MVIFLTTSNLAASAERLLTTEERPVNYLEQGKLTGITTDVVREILKRLNRPIKIEILPWARLMRIAGDHANIVVFTAGRTQERINQGFHFLGPVTTRKHALWELKENPINIRVASDVINQHLRIGGLMKDWRTIYWKKLGAIVDETTTHHQSLVKLYHNRVDLWISSDLEAPSACRIIQTDCAEIKIAYVFKEAPSFIMFSKGTSPKIIKEYTATFAAMRQTDFFEKEAEKWSRKLNLNILYSPETGYRIVN